jgi:DnaK suppressor protein
MRDEYLTPEQLQTIKAILEEQLASILDQSRDAVNNLVEVREQDADPLDLAITESNREWTLRLADRERQLITKIRRSLERMHDGEYGTCESCGNEIGFNRLMARPVANLCIDCKTEAEQVESRRRVF